MCIAEQIPSQTLRKSSGEERKVTPSPQIHHHAGKSFDRFPSYTEGTHYKRHRRTALQVTQEDHITSYPGEPMKLHRRINLQVTQNDHFPRYMGELFYKLHQRPHFN